MELAFREAEKAFNKGEVPVGAIVVLDERVIGRGHNLVETLQDPTAHAEMIALTAAANTLASWRLDNTSLYVTLEPCPMCTGAIVLCRTKVLVFAAKDRRWGACGSVLNIPNTDGIDNSLTVRNGIMAERSTSLLQSFFEKLRHK
jgi:tRNA(adenine34) deaminase